MSRLCVPLTLTSVVVIQVSRSKTHRANKVLYVSGLKMLLSTGSSRWNQRQVVLWDPVGTGPRNPHPPQLLPSPTGPAAPVCVQEDLSEPVHEEDLDGSAGVLFPFYDPDRHLLYLAGKVRGQPASLDIAAACRRVSGVFAAGRRERPLLPAEPRPTSPPPPERGRLAAAAPRPG